MGKAPTSPTYQMPPPNNDFWVYETLAGVRDPATGKHLFRIPENHVARWLQPAEFERMCDEDPGVQRALKAAAKAKYKPEAHERVRKAVAKVFEQQYLPQVCEAYFGSEDTVTQFFLAKRAAQDADPDYFASD